MTKASRGDSTGWDCLLGPDSAYHIDIPQYSQVEDDKIPQASLESQLLAAHNELGKGSLRKASNELTSLGVAPDRAFVRKQLQSMNPEALRPFGENHNEHLGNWDISPSEIKKELFKMGNDSAPGPSGISIQSLKKLSASEEGINALSPIVNRILNGTEPNWKRLTASRLIPLVKSEEKIRPIAVGEVIMRLASRILLRNHTQDLSHFLRPTQLGVKEPGGTEKIVHMVRREVQNGKAIMTLDLANAFNSISRETIREVLEDKFPSMLPYFTWAYKGNAALWYRGELLASSQEGVRQGDPLGPALFAVGMQGLLEQLKTEFPQVNLFAYLDDVTAAGEPEDLLALADRFSELAKHRGLKVNESKSELLLPSGHHELSDIGDIRIKREGIRVLGSPVGSPTFEDQWCVEYVRHLKKMMLLKTEPSIPIQSRYLLLRDSVVPSFNHLLRTVPPASRKNGTVEFDDAIVEVCRLLLGTDYFGDYHELTKCSQLYFPLRYGGLGLTSVSSISLPAYVASVWEAGVGFEENECASIVAELREQDVDISEGDLKELAPNRKQQRVLSDQVMKGKVNRYLRDQDEPFIARMKAAQEPGAHDWLRALPNSSIKKFSDVEWRIGVRFRLGLKVTNVEIPDICPLCDAFVDDVGSHAFKCSYADLMNGRTERHNKLRDAIIGALSSWGFPTEKEPKIESESQLRGDVEVVQTDGPVILDVSVIHPSVVGTQQNLRPSAATKVRERSKMNKYEKVCQDVGKKVLPFVFQSYGGIGEKALGFLSELKNRPASLYVYQPVRFVESVRESLSCRLMRSNTRLVTRWLQLVSPVSSGGVAYYDSAS
jgi:hypothetical protein